MVQRDTTKDAPSFHITIPDKRTQFTGKKKHLTVRAPIDLITFLDDLAIERGWQLSELLVYVLDHFAQAELLMKKGKEVYSARTERLAPSSANKSSPSAPVAASKVAQGGRDPIQTHYKRRKGK